jgi:sugar lactone lactonase YvrE
MEVSAKLVPSVTSLPGFGSVTLGSSSAAQSFAITNTGQAASSAISLSSGNGEFIIQSDATGSCMSGVTTLAAGASCNVSVVFTPAVAGYRAGTITFWALSGGNGNVGTTGTAPAIPGTLAIFAGVPSGEGSADGTGAAAHFYYPAGVAADTSGNVFVADNNNNTIRKITPAGVVTTIAGSAGSFGSTDGTGTAARFQGPEGVAVDGAGNVFVADGSNHTIRKITPAGVVTTLAGKAGSDGHADGTGAAAQFATPTGVAVDGAGNVFVADGRIRKITPAGVVTTLAETVDWSYGEGIAADGAGNVFVANTYSNTVWKITPAGVVTTLAGTAGSSGSEDGTGADARFNRPTGVAVDKAGNVFVADSSNHTIRKITPVGVATTLAGTAGWSGSDDGTGAAAHFNHPMGVAVDGVGNAFIADAYNNTVRKITPDGVVTTLAGTAASGDRTDGTGAAARFYSPAGVVVDGTGNVFVADSEYCTIRKITPAGVVTTLAGTARAIGSPDGTGPAARFNTPQGLAADQAGNVFVADSGNNKIRMITPAGIVTTLAGAAGTPGSADGTGSAARFNGPTGVAVDNDGNVFAADNGNHTIRKITPAGAVTTLAGTAGASGSVDGIGAAASFNDPQGVAVDKAGDIFVADNGNHTIRKITSAGIVTTFAGTAGSFGSADGTGAAARFNYPTGVAVDGSGNLYVSDGFNHAIRKITPDGVVTTIVGVVPPPPLGNVPGPLPASITWPGGVAVDPATGSLYITVDSAVMVATF